MKKPTPPEPALPGTLESDRAAQLERQQREASEESRRKAQEARERIDAKLAHFLDDSDLEDTTGVRNLEGMVRPHSQPPPDVVHAATIMAKEDEPNGDGPTTIRPEKLDAEKPRSERILVVDDSEDLAEIIAERLKHDGYSVRIAVDGLDALSKILKDKPPPDCVLLDLQLPYLSGQGVIAALQTTALADIPILIISGGTAESLPPEVRKEFVFIKKGTNMLDEALVAIRERIAEYRARPTGRHFI